ncbi:hypothetical protein [Nocardia ignorata]|uniref:Uncharacterized protein n=1 Tax=Nocardia ignorata TaxID=145285 RepID=A0A4R6P061_NOCIG|nr:hypothetical protein [Nocardia ignorata]TDP29765.1 hypothetical protein DFR75_11226 [Nocardia ignorata]
MAVLIYAQPDDLIAGGWLTGTAPANAALLLRFASILVRRVTMCDHYDVDTAGLPTDTAIAEAFRDATCAQAAMWSLAGLNPVAGTVGRELAVASQTADGGSVVYGDSITGAEVERALKQLHSAALLILRNAGLASTRPD